MVRGWRMANKIEDEDENEDEKQGGQRMSYRGA
jgi:hypothetical protein